jgi:DNA polymerase
VRPAPGHVERLTRIARIGVGLGNGYVHVVTRESPDEEDRVGSADSGRRAADEFEGAQRWVPARPSIAALQAAVHECRGCELYRAATQAVMGEGPSGAPLMLVGEQPGDREDEAGRPFVGPAGRLLDRALDQAGIDPGTVYKTNVVKHFRYERRGSRRIHKGPSRWHVAACEPWLLAELEAIGPRVVVLLGATAARAVYGSSFRVTTSRGTRLDWPTETPFAPRAALATMHPSAVLRSRDGDADLEALVRDLRVANNLLG